LLGELEIGLAPNGDRGSLQYLRNESIYGGNVKYLASVFSTYASAR